MNVLRFLARDAADAVEQIRSRLGPDAVVLTVTPEAGAGVGRLWRKRRLEVLACLPEVNSHDQPAGAPQPGGSGREETTSDARGRRSEVRGPVRSEPADFSSTPGPGLTRYGRNGKAVSAPLDNKEETVDPGALGWGGPWSSGQVLHQIGLQPVHVEKVLERARSLQGNTPPASFAEEIALVRSVLAGFWRPSPRTINRSPSLHVFIGPPGSGKTTVLCKWLAKSVLVEGRAARAWRLDSRAANFAGLLDLYGEILGVPVERQWKETQALTGFDLGLVDLPGIDARDSTTVKQLRARLEAMPSAQVHLVLNAAYDVSVTLAQARAFAALPVTDLIFTHLDEEKRRGKLWNFVLGTNYTVGFLSGGQNIPGDFSAANPALLFPQQIRSELQSAAILRGDCSLGKRLADNRQRTSAG